MADGRSPGPGVTRTRRLARIRDGRDTAGYRMAGCPKRFDANLPDVDRVEEIEAAISGLPPEEYRRLVEWFRVLEETRWDKQMDRDSADGKLDFLFAEAESELEQGLLRNWPGRR